MTRFRGYRSVSSPRRANKTPSRLISWTFNYRWPTVILHSSIHQSRGSRVFRRGLGHFGEEKCWTANHKTQKGFSPLLFSLFYDRNRIFIGFNAFLRLQQNLAMGANFQNIFLLAVSGRLFIWCEERSGQGWAEYWERKS